MRDGKMARGGKVHLRQTRSGAGLQRNQSLPAAAGILLARRRAVTQTTGAGTAVLTQPMRVITTSILDDPDVSALVKTGDWRAAHGRALKAAKASGGRS